MKPPEDIPTSKPLDKLKTLLQDRWWRINHLYHITNKEGHITRFKANWAQTELHHKLHTRNDILKVRQLGISTYVAILILDYCLFTKNKHAGIIDKTLNDAKSKLEKIKFAYNNLDYLPPNPSPEEKALAKLGAQLKQNINCQASQTSIKFSTQSSVTVGTSLRGGTYQLLHISELAYVAAHAPIRAREIIHGSVNAVSKDSIVIRESTHEGGKWGLNYQLTKASMEMIGKPLSQLDWKFFFFSWIQHPEYSLDTPSSQHGINTPDTEELEEYYQNLHVQHGISLSPGQKAWYAAQWRTLSHATRQEYPTTPEEAFQTQVEGAIYGKWIDMLRSQGRLNAEFSTDDASPLYTSWDIGMSDNMSIWLTQIKGDGKYYLVDALQCNNKTLDYYINKCRDWENKYGTISKHLLPHDAAKRDWEGVSFEGKLRAAGFNVSIIPRTKSIWSGIFATRRFLNHCIIHERCSQSQKIDGIEYMSPVNALENYQTAPLGANGIERNEPLHNACSHAADALRYIAEAIEAGLVANAGAALSHPHNNQTKPLPLAKGADIFNLY